MRTASDEARVGDDSRPVGAVLLAHDSWSWASLDGRPVLAWSLDALAALPQLGQVALVARAERLAAADVALAGLPGMVARHVVPLDAPVDASGVGAALQAGMDALGSESETILLCDMAAPLVRTETVRALLAAVQPGSLVVATEPIKDTVKVINPARITGTIPREHLTTAHAPLAATRRDLLTLLRTLARVPAGGLAGGPVALAHLAAMATHAQDAGLALIAVPGRGDTLCVASPEDLAVASGLLSARRGAP